MNKKKIITVGLVRGRHEMPVSSYIFNGDIEDVLDFDAINIHIKTWVEFEVGISITTGLALNQVYTPDVEVYMGNAELCVYVTGLTCLTAALIKYCAINGVRLSLMHYDSDDNVYVKQVIFQ